MNQQIEVNFYSCNTHSEASCFVLQLDTRVPNHSNYLLWISLQIPKSQFMHSRYKKDPILKIYCHNNEAMVLFFSIRWNVTVENGVFMDIKCNHFWQQFSSGALE